MADVDTSVKIVAFMGAAFVMAVGSIAPALAQGMVASRAIENIGKFPESANSIRNSLILSLGVIETSAIYALVIALLLRYS